MDELVTPRMVYRVGTMCALESGAYDWRIVPDQPALQAALADGWHLDQYAAKAAAEAHAPAAVPEPAPADDAPPTRDELEQKAAELGIKVDGRWSDARLSKAIAEKLAA